MKYSFTIFLLCFSLSALCQNSLKLSNLLESSIDQEDKESISVGSGAWIICNTDSSYYKSNTVKLYNDINYFYQLSSCCNFVQWTFYKKNQFLENTSQTCEEPSSSQVKTINYTIKIISKGKTTFLLLKDEKNVTTNFKLISISQIKLANNVTAQEIVLNKIDNTIPSL